ncbi:MAG: SGNH/GDSL hydrolase family protein [Planctomycetota bacterium]|nr:SGNH/GDSL hydrolase family protein [Planctomycetota bacterium]
MSTEQAPAEAEVPGKLSKKRKLQFSAMMVGFVILILGVLEVVTRIHYRGRFPSGTIEHPIRNHTHRPNWQGFEGAPKRGIVVKTNNLGLREDTVLAKKLSEGKRIMVLGDSVAFGYRLHRKQTISVKLQEALAEEKGPWEVVNAGCYGYGVQDEGHWLNELSTELKTDLVILIVCYNDFTQLETSPTEVPPDFVQSLNANSALAFSISRKWHQVARWFQTRDFRKLTPEEIERKALIKDGKEDERAQKMHDHIAKIDKTTKSMGGRLAVVVWPGRIQYREYLEDARIPKEQQQLAERLKKTFPGLQVVLPYAEFKNCGPVEEIYMDHCHPSPRGVELFTPRLVKLVKDSL